MNEHHALTIWHREGGRAIGRRGSGYTGATTTTKGNRIDRGREGSGGELTGALKMIIDGLSKWLFSGDEAMMMSALTIMPGTTIEAASAVSAATEAAAARSLSCCWPAYPPLPPRGIRLAWARRPFAVASARCPCPGPW